MKLPAPRFSIKWLFIFITLAAIGMVLVTQVGMKTAHFEITGTSLEVNEDGLVNGMLTYRYSRVRLDDMPTEYFDFVCKIANLDQSELAELKKGDKTKLQFRLYDVGPFEKQNVYNMFVTDFLKIKKAHVKEVVVLSDYTCLLYTSPSPRDATLSRMPSSA